MFHKNLHITVPKSLAQDKSSRASTIVGQGFLEKIQNGDDDSHVDTLGWRRSFHFIGSLSSLYFLVLIENKVI